MLFLSFWLNCIVRRLQAGTGIAELIALETSKQVVSYFWCCFFFFVIFSFSVENVVMRTMHEYFSY